MFSTPPKKISWWGDIYVKRLERIFLQNIHRAKRHTPLPMSLLSFHLLTLSFLLGLFTYVSYTSLTWMCKSFSGIFSCWLCITSPSSCFTDLWEAGPFPSAAVCLRDQWCLYQWSGIQKNSGPVRPVMLDAGWCSRRLLRFTYLVHIYLVLLDFRLPGLVLALAIRLRRCCLYTKEALDFLRKIAKDSDFLGWRAKM